jgi:glucosamine-6-phosphate deaminase
MEHPIPLKLAVVGNLRVETYATRQEMGTAAACDVSDRVQRLIGEQDMVRMVFAAAPSQNEFLDALAGMPALDWGRVEAFHMDEYVGLEENAPQLFGRYLREHLFDRVRPGRVEFINGAASDFEDECARYSALLSERPIDIVCAGIGENGHLAFNDPHVADFQDPKSVKVVTLDDVCRSQQVHDGAFATIDDVPTAALSLTISSLMSARWLYCVVPGPTKTVAVRRTLSAPIATACPATIMRRHPRAVLYIDVEAAAEL